LSSVLRGDASESTLSATNPQAGELAASLIANFKQEAFPALVKAIEDAAQQSATDGSELLSRTQRAEAKRQRMEHLKARLRGKRRQRDSSDDAASKFYGFDKVDVAAKCAVVQQILNKEVNYVPISNQLVCIEA
jgi:hypothetical protein